MHELVTWLVAFDQLGVWSHALIALCLGILAAFAVTLVSRVGLGLAERVARRTRSTQDDEILARVKGPLGLLSPIVGLHVASAWLGWKWVVGAAWVTEGLLFTYAVVAAFEILVLETWLQQRQGIKVPAPVRQLVIGGIYGAVLLSIAGDVFGIDVTPLLATGSVTTVVLGLALQGPLSNLFAGIVLHVENHPKVGDWILVDGREGEVVEIGWRTTRARMFTDDILLVPNAAMLNAQVVNFTAPTPLHGRTVPVPVPLDVPPHVFDAWVRESLVDIPHVVLTDTPRTKTWLVAIDDHCQRYNVRFWVDHFRYHDDAESEFLKALWYRFAREGVAFPAPFQTVRTTTGAAPGMAGLDPVRPSTGFPPKPDATKT